MRSHCKTQDEARNNAGTLSLDGIAQNITCPIFIVNGRLDRIVPAATPSGWRARSKVRPS